MDEPPPLPPVEPAGAQTRDSPRVASRGIERLLKRLIVVGVIAVLAGVLYWQFGDLLSLERLAERESQLLASARRSPAVVLAVVFLVYVAVTAFSLPAAALFTMGIGWLCRELFGELAGLLTAVVLVSFASTSGATLAFLMSRFLFRDAIQRRFGDRLAKFNEALRREGAFYLFTLRLIPAVPFFVINVVMGLTPLRVRTYWWVSQIGMLAGTFVYVYAGSTIPSIGQIADRSQLRAEDIHDWPGFLNQLRHNPESGAKGPADQIRQLLPEDARQVLATSSSRSPLDHDQRVVLIRGLNDVLKRPELSLAKPWHGVALKPQEISKLNRRLLEQTYPDHVFPPQPIVSVKLIIAFTLLGLFPLVVKKIMSRVRGAKPESNV